MNTVTIIREGESAKSFDAPAIFKSAQADIEKENAEKAIKATEAAKKAN
jgi:hypothetical protein